MAINNLIYFNVSKLIWRGLSRWDRQPMFSVNLYSQKSNKGKKEKNVSAQLNIIFAQKKGLGHTVQQYSALKHLKISGYLFKKVLQMKK